MRTVLREEIKRYLLDTIVRGELKGGDRLIETRVARQLGVSQAPVREAIRDLEQMGVVETEPFRGAVIKTLTGKETRDIYAVRAVLEELAARQAVQRLEARDLEQLSRLVDDMVSAARAGDQAQFVVLNAAFHEHILRTSGNAFLVKLWALMQPAQWTFVTASVTHRTLVELAERHRAVVEALASRDPERAADAVRRHITELGDEVLFQD